MREKNIFHFPANGLIHFIYEVSRVEEYWMRLIEEAGAWSLADWIATARPQQCVLYDGQIARVMEQIFLL